MRVKPQPVKLQAAMQQLLQSVQTSCCPAYSAAVLLRALSHVNGQVRAATNLRGQTRSQPFPHTDLLLCLSLSWPPCFLSSTASWSRAARTRPRCFGPRPS